MVNKLSLFLYAWNKKKTLNFTADFFYFTRKRCLRRWTVDLIRCWWSRCRTEVGPVRADSGWPAVNRRKTDRPVSVRHRSNTSTTLLAVCYLPRRGLCHDCCAEVPMMSFFNEFSTTTTTHTFNVKTCTRAAGARMQDFSRGGQNHRRSQDFLWGALFTALHGMQTRSCDEISVRPSVCLSVKRVHCDKTEESYV